MGTLPRTLVKWEIVSGYLWGHYTDGMGIISVKGGKSVNPGMIRDLRGTIERENAEMGVFISLIPPSLQMESEAASAGFFESSQGRHPRIQIKTIADLLDGKGIDSPLQYTTVTMVEAGRQAARGTQKKQAIPPNELLRQRNLLLPISGTGRKKDQEEFELENTSSQLEKAVVKRARNSQI